MQLLSGTIAMHLTSIVFPYFTFNLKAYSILVPSPRSSKLKLTVATSCEFAFTHPLIGSISKDVFTGLFHSY
jgi:hypothetical protein